MEAGLFPDLDVVRLSGGDISSASTLVHELLESDPETLRALEELGIRSSSPETAFKDLASALLGRPGATWPGFRWDEFWRARQ